MKKQTLLLIVTFCLSLVTFALSLLNFFYNEGTRNTAIIWDDYFKKEIKRLSSNDWTFYENLKDVNFLLRLPEIPISTPSGNQ